MLYNLFLNKGNNINCFFVNSHIKQNAKREWTATTA